MFILFYTIAVLITVSLLGFYLGDSVSLRKKIVLGIVVYASGHYGAKLLSYFEANNFSNFSFHEFINEKNGLTFYGGYLPTFCIILFLIFKVSSTSLQFNKVFAASTIIFHFGYIIGRIGCHLSADGCYGKVTFSKWGMRYTWGSYQTLFPVYPTPLYEIVLHSILLLYFGFLYYKKYYKLVILQSLIIFPLSRFFIEYLRTNSIFRYGLTFNQIFSIGILIILPMLYLLLNKIKKNEKYSV